MGCYRPKDPQVHFCCAITDKEILRKITETSFEWYKESDYNKEHIQYFNGVKSSYDDLIESIDECSADIDLGDLIYNNDFFSDMWNITPFGISGIEEHNELYMTPNYDKGAVPDWGREEISLTIHFGDNISDIIKEHTIDFSNPSSYQKVSKFMKFLADAKLSPLVNDFSWRFIHSAWN